MCGWTGQVASTGTASSALRDLINPGLSVWSLASNVLQPLFQGGRLRAGVDRAEATIDEGLAAYTSSALQAYAEVESALAADEFLAQRSGYLVTATEQSRAAERLATDRYRAGLEDYVTVLESLRQALQAEGERIGDVIRSGVPSGPRQCWRAAPALQGRCGRCRGCRPKRTRCLHSTGPDRLHSDQLFVGSRSRTSRE